jgi:hypothetical protein
MTKNSRIRMEKCSTSRILKIGELKMMRWLVKRNLFEGKPKPLERRKPARMTAGKRAPAKQQAFPRTPAGATTGNHDGGLSDNSETEEEEWEAPKEEEFNKIAYHRRALWYWCSSESGGKCAECWRKHKPMECKGTARSTMSVARSMMKAKLGDAEKLKLLLLKVLSVVIQQR